MKTPTYHVYDMYKSHQDAESFRLEIDCEQVEGLPQVSGSASVRQGRLTLTLTNLSLDKGAELRIDLQGIGRKPAEVTELEYRDRDVRSHNSFEDPEAVKLRARAELEISTEGACLELEPASVVRLSLEL